MSGVGGFKNDSSNSEDLEDDMDWIDVDDESVIDAEEIHAEAQSGDGDPDNELRSSIKPPKKKKSSLLPFLLLLAAGGSGWYYLYSSGVLQPAASGTTATDTPVVAIEPEVVPPTTPTEQSLAAPETPDAGVITQDPIVIPPDSQTSQLLPIDQTTPVQEQNTDTGVLTPLPDTAILSQTELPPLEDIPVPGSTEVATELAQLTEQPEVDVTPSDAASLLPTSQLDQSPALQTAESSEAKLLEETEKKPNDLMALKAEAPLEDSVPLPLPELTPDSAIANISGATDALKADSAIASPSALSPDKIAELTQDQPKPVEPTVAVIPELTPPVADSQAATVDTSSASGSPPVVIAAQTPIKEVQKAAEPNITYTKANEPPPAVIEELKKPETKPELAEFEGEKNDTARTVAKKEAPKQETLPKKTVSVNWTLRSAQPGAAVLYDPSTGNMKSVEIGDRIEGIGKIQSIATENGKWVVRGSSGKVSQ